MILVLQNASSVFQKGDFERRRSRSAENIDLEFQESRRSSSASQLKTQAIPEFARLDHDDLYKAIDIYLKGHPHLNKSERKRLCRMLYCKKLLMEVCMHVAQNELLPLREVVQVPFFEQARAAMSGGQVAELPSNIKAHHR
ncbi:hypothetical protein HAX54_023209 [Datura stramonium]|uniref:NPH3 domain-containing protein n=1 Tax=Datura stramonium TaxID=4076 RepID=A0ABS8S4T2_DATST|nr:hypothetical protein [Datura stramonium]